MHRTVVLAVLMIFSLINLFPCAFAQSNLRVSSDKQRITIAQQRDGNTAANDRAFWDSVKDSKNPDELRAYLEQFPSGVFAPLAKARLKVLERGDTQSQSENKAAVTGPKETSKDERFIAYDNGTVLDTKTHLMWAAKDSEGGITWKQAKFYCENYRAGGFTDWRMPTLDELAELYALGKSYKALPYNYDVHLTELIELSACSVRSVETGRILWDETGLFFNFCTGKKGETHVMDRNHLRALPVRSPK